MTPTDPLDRLVAAHLDAVGGTVDSRAVLGAVHRRLNDERPTVAGPTRIGMAWRVRIAVAAALLLAIMAGMQTNPARASAGQLVRDAQAASTRSADRCYTVWVEPAPELIARFPLLDRDRRNTLWTRGDRFVVEDAFRGRAGAWGRDEEGRVWVAPNRRLGLVFPGDRLPPELTALLDIRTLRLDSLLSDVLSDFVVTDDGTTLGRERRVRAEPKPGRAHPFLRSATLTFDPETHEVRRLVLERGLPHRPLATVTFTLRASAPLADDGYRLRGHIDRDATVLGPDQQVRRNAQLLRLMNHLP